MFSTRLGIGFRYNLFGKVQLTPKDSTSPLTLPVEFIGSSKHKLLKQMTKLRRSNCLRRKQNLIFVRGSNCISQLHDSFGIKFDSLVASRAGMTRDLSLCLNQNSPLEFRGLYRAPTKFIHEIICNREFHQC